MAISTGVRPHQAWIEAGGHRFPVIEGSCSLTASEESGTFSCAVAMDGAEDAFANPSALAASVIVSAGTGEQTLIKGELDEAEFDYILRRITVHGRDASAKLHQTKINESWQNKKPDEIIKDVAKKAGLDNVAIDIQGKLKAGRNWDKDWNKLADNVSASSVVHKMCEMLGARWWVDKDGKLHVSDKGKGSYSVTYTDTPIIQSDAKHLVVRLNYQASKKIEVTVKSWHQKKKKVIEKKKTVPLPPRRPTSLGGTGGSAEFPASTGSGTPTPPTKPADLGKLAYDYSIGNLDDDHAGDYAGKLADQHASSELEFNITCVGDPACVAGMRLELQGTAFAQTLDIYRVDHHFGGSGYTMTITARGASEGRQAE